MEVKKSIVNLILRLLNIFIKGLFSIILIKILSVSEYANWAIILNISTLCSFLLGFEIFYYYNRELTNAFFLKFKRKQIKILVGQYVSYFILYLVLLPFICISIIYQYSYITISLIIILINNHVTTEISRIVIHIERYTLSGIVVLLGQSLWMLLILALWIVGYKMTLVDIIKFYAFISSLGTVISIILYLQIFNLNLRIVKISAKNLDWVTLIRIMKASIFIVISSQLSNSNILIGRLVLNHINSEISGVYSYFQNMASISIVVLDYLVARVYLTTLLKPNNFTISIVKEFKFKLLVVSVVMFLSMGVLGYPFFKNVLEKKIFLDNYYIYLLINFSALIINLGYFYNCLLYIQKMDKSLFISNALSTLLVLAISPVAIIYPKYCLLIVSTGFLMSIILNFTVKHSLTKVEYKGNTI